MAQQALGVVGGAIGAYFGGPYGAQLGYAIGSAIGSAIDPPKVKGPKLGEVPVQTGRDGVARVTGWGTIHTAGNILLKNPVVEVEEKTSSGKGGGTVSVNTRRLRTYSIGFVGVPIKAFLRIWQNDKLVYDAGPSPEIPWSESQKYAEALTFYLGGEDQLPDPELETHWGVGTTPAFRGTAHIVWNNFDITDFGSSIPIYRVEVQIDGPDQVTSRPYPLEAQDLIELGITGPSGYMNLLPSAAIGISAGFGGVYWDQLRFEIFPDPPAIGISAGFGGLTWSSIASRIYPDPPAIGISAGFGGVFWDRVLVTQKMVPEKLALTVSGPTGSMTAV